MIALIRLPSKLAPSDANYRGPILFNPGKSIFVFLLLSHLRSLEQVGLEVPEWISCLV